MPEHEFLPKVRFSAALWEAVYRATLIDEGVNFVLMIKSKVGWPEPSFKVKTHRQQPAQYPGRIVHTSCPAIPIKQPGC
jgi:hypothetical protein